MAKTSGWAEWNVKFQSAATASRAAGPVDGARVAVTNTGLRAGRRPLTSLDGLSLG